MKKIFYLMLAANLAFFTFSCDDQERPAVGITEKTPVEADKTDQGEQGTLVADAPIEAGGIILTPLTDSPDFPDAILELNTPAQNAKIKKGEVKFSYNIKNFKLGNQTSGLCQQHCANSQEGQHIHLILNNAPYIAKYEPEFTQKLEEGRYVALSFLSRSYHESLKHREAYDLRQFVVGKDNGQEVDLTAPHMFYSRPKGEYKGEDTRRVLLDFYLVNTDLAPDGNRVRATINGNAFILIRWQPYIMEGLPDGEVTIKLELLDRRGRLIEGPFNSVERKITLTGTVG